MRASAISISLTLLRCCLEESAESFEEPHNLGLAQNIGEDFEVGAEFGEAVEVHERGPLVGIECVEWNHGSVNAA